MKKTKIRFFVFDLDGTALGGHEPYAQFPRPFARLLDDLSAQGVQWATNTTWPVAEQFKIVRKSGVKSDPAFLCGETGLSLARVKGGKLVFCPRHAKTVLERSKRFRRKAWPLVRTAFEKLLRDDLVYRFSFDDYETRNLIDFSCKKKDTAKVVRLLRPLLAKNLFYPWAPLDQPANIFLPFYMNKGAALRLMLRHLNLRPAEVVAAGNAGNDLPMLKRSLARWLICPANADAPVLEAVRRRGGLVGRGDFSWGVVDAVKRVLEWQKTETELYPSGKRPR
jgi:hydroxymethylpyrimidine pyrophosphatase-like HAD family hydrolase